LNTGLSNDVSGKGGGVSDPFLVDAREKPPHDDSEEGYMQILSSRRLRGKGKKRRAQRSAIFKKGEKRATLPQRLICLSPGEKKGVAPL